MLRWLKCILLSLLVLLAFHGAKSQLLHFAQADSSVWGQWIESKQLFDGKNYEEALRSLQAHSKDDFSYYYNVGTIYFKLGKFGASLAFLEKANHLHPNDLDTQFNLFIARRELARTLGHDRLDPSSGWLEQLADHTTSQEAQTLTYFIGLSVLLLWSRAYLKTRNLKHVFVQTPGLFAIFGLFLVLGIFGIQKYASSSLPAVCLQKEIIRSGPGDRYLELTQVDAGIKLRVINLIEDQKSAGIDIKSSSNSEIWRQVRFSENGIGWVRESGLLLL